MLIKDYYIIESQESISDSVTLFDIRLCPDCPIYQGHFPEQPVSPGVCNIQMLKELAEKVAGTRFVMNQLNLCRLTTLITPNNHPTLQAYISIEEKSGIYKLVGKLGNGEEIYLEMKAELSPAV